MAGPSVGGTPLASEATVWSARVLEYLDKSYVYVAALREAGIFNAVEGGTLFARTLFDPIEKSGLVTVTFTWQVRLG